MIQRDKQPAGAIVAGNLIALDTFANNVAAFKHHAAEHFRGIRAVGFFDNVDIAAIGVNQLAAVASAGAEADTRAFQQHHIVAHFGQMQRRREAGIAAADDADVAADRFVQRRERLIAVGAGGVIAGGMFAHD